ncbi:MAG: PqqD family protein [Actinomycetota bacterium]
MPDRYRVNRPKIVAKDEGDEVLLLNLKTKDYYTLLGSATGIWAAIERTASAEDIVASLPSRYEGVPDDAADIVAAFIQDLLGEELIALSTGAEEEDEPPPQRHQRESWFLGSSGDNSKNQEAPEPSEYEPPRLRKFASLEDVIFQGAEADEA